MERLFLKGKNTDMVWGLICNSNSITQIPKCQLTSSCHKITITQYKYYKYKRAQFCSSRTWTYLEVLLASSVSRSIYAPWVCSPEIIGRILQSIPPPSSFSCLSLQDMKYNDMMSVHCKNKISLICNEEHIMFDPPRNSPINLVDQIRIIFFGSGGLEVARYCCEWQVTH